MPQATATIVLKNAANVDKTFSLASPAAGYGGICEYVLKEGTVSTAMKRLTYQATRGRTSGTANMKLSCPTSIVEPSTGLVRITDKMEIYVKAAVPDAFPEAEKDDVIALVKSAVAHAITQAFLRDADSVS